MPRKGKMKRQFKDKPLDLLLDGILIPLIFILIAIIKIGDVLKNLLKLVISYLVQNGNFITKLIKKLPKFSLPRLPKFKISFPKFNLPKTITPKAPRPKIILPKPPRLYFPQVPRFHFPKIYFSYPSLKLRWFILGVLFSIFFIFLPYQIWFWLSELPSPSLLTTREVPVTSKIFDRNGFLLYEIYTDQNRSPVTLPEIPQTLKEATIAIEDKDFYKHPGFSLRGILRATRETFFNHQTQGGSTITQQLIRSALLTPEPTISRKLKEIILSFWAERLYSKDQILEMYFNQVPYGGTAWGVEAAAQTYFGKSVKQLNLSESAFLAALPASPSVYSPFGTHPEQGLIRQEEVLRKMAEQGYVTPEQQAEALNKELEFQPAKTEIKAPHFVMYVKDLLEKKYGAKRVATGGLQIITTLDFPLQEMAQEVVTNEVNNLASLRVGNGAVLITNPKNGEILAMVGSKNYFDIENEGNVNIVLSDQQPGSSIKVVNYALALDNGFTAASILDDSPVSYQVAGQPVYTPINYDGKFHGKVTLRTALASSYNIPAVKVLAKLGVKNMIEKGKLMGITSWKDDSRYGLSLTLGGGEVTMLDMARVYGTLADNGQRHELNSVLKISDYKGQILEEAGIRQGFPAVSQGAAFILANILADNNARTPAFGNNSLLTIPGKTVSVKTGTSNDLRDNWAIGFTPSYVVTAWVGNNDNSPMGRIASGITGATPIWNKVMSSLLKTKPDEPILPPIDVVKGDACGKTEYFIRGTEKSAVCPPQPQIQVKENLESQQQ